LGLSVLILQAPFKIKEDKPILFFPALTEHNNQTKGQSLAKRNRFNYLYVIHPVGALDTKSLPPVLPALKGHYTKTKGATLRKKHYSYLSPERAE
jgi:hypothetical protein